MKDPIESKINRWVQNGDDRFIDINLKVNHLHEWLFYDYEPLQSAGPNFLKRLNDWLENLSDENDQKLLFELVPHIFYMGREELNVLYREAYQTNFARWLIDLVVTELDINSIHVTLNQEVVDTWFCPLTDSLRINQFYHINDIPGKHDHRPDWRSLRTFGDVKLIRDYITKEGIKRIVLLEDFIGNGGQVSKAVNFVATNFSDIPVLVIPLVICPEGVTQSQLFMKAHPNVKIDPVLSIPHSYFVQEIESDNQVEFLRKIHGLILSTYPQVSNSDDVDVDLDPFGPFGWRKTGGLIVMHTNTPNNTIPLLHNKSNTWNPLFKRHKRV